MKLDPSINERSRAITVVQPGRRRVFPDTAELWRFRELLKALVDRDIRIRYKQTVLGILWAVIQPFVAMVVFTIVLNKAVGVPSEPGIPYPIYTYSGLVLWQYFAEALLRSSRSLTTNTVLVTKVYFPRLLAPISGVISPLLDMVFAMVILVGMMIWYGTAISWTIVFVVPLVIATITTAAAFGIGLAAMNVEYRDVGYAVPMGLQLWMFLTPVFYAASSVSGTLEIIEWVNPMSSILATFRWSLIGTEHAQIGPAAVSAGVTLVILYATLRYFERVQRTFADSI